MAKKNKKNRKIVRYRRPLNINVGMIIFALIFAYMAFYVYTYMKRDKVEFYEVSEGAIVTDRRHTGLIFREEETRYTDQAGNISYYLREGKKAAVGTRVYSIDDTGKLAELLAEQTGGESALSQDNLSSLKKQLSSFSQTFTDADFRDIYNVKNDLDAEVLEYASVDALKNLDSVVSQMGASFAQVRADKAGVVSYAVDSMESLTPSQVTAEMFDRTGYSRPTLRSGQLVEKGAAAYKLVTSESWSIVFQLDEDEAALYNGKESLTVRFSGQDLEAAGAYSILTGADGGTYGKLDFARYMEQFISDRFVDFEVVVEEVRGLKIPKSAVTEVNFYQIPKDFLVLSGDGSPQGFLKETYTDAGTSAVLVSCSIYNSDDDFYYVATDEEDGLTSGDYLVRQDSQDRFQVGTTAAIQGVYNINRGYTAFRRIEILAENDEYYTVKKGTSYGLSVYDHIVLNAKAVTGNGQIVYQ